MFDKLLEKIKRVDEIESKLLSIFEGKSWEYIAKALYTILDDIDTASDMCKEDLKGFQDVVLKLQAKKNEFLSSDGYTLKPVIEIDSDSEEQPNNSMLQPDEPDEDDSTVTPMKYNATTSECVCHIYGMDDDELLEFYRNTILSPEHYTSAGAQKQYPKDKAETEREIEKRGLNIPVNENLTGHARRELELAGMFDKEVDGSEAAGSWNRLCAEAVIELMEVFAGQGHSGFSASMTQDLFSRLAKYEPLTELTDNPGEWRDIHEYCSDGPDMWQSTRSPSCFSKDRGKTYWDIDEDWNKHEDEDGSVWSGGLSEEEWTNRPMHQSKHTEEKEPISNEHEVDEHIAENGLKEFEYLLHHIIIDDKGKEEIHHCLVYDHVANMFEQGHLVVENGKVTLDGKKVKDGTFHVLKGLESSQEVVWSDEEAKENKIVAKKMESGMTLKDKSKVW